MNVLVIGSSLIDLFVSFQNKDHLKIENNTVSFNLGDKIPIDITTLTLGGNGVNVSSALQKLEIPTSFYTYLGDDILSSHIKKLLEEEGISLLIESEKTTVGSLSIIFRLDTDRIIYSYHNVFPHSFDASLVTTKPDLIYLTSIGKEWEDSYSNVLRYAQENAIPIALSPGSQQMEGASETFIKALHQSQMLFCNMEEAKKINVMLSGEAIDNTRELLLNIKNNGFDLLSVTDGERGAYAVDKDNSVQKIQAVRAQGTEKTGAGDAYAAGFLAAYLYKNPIETCMLWGALSAAGEMSYEGSRTGQLTLKEIEEKAVNTAVEIETV